MCMSMCTLLRYSGQKRMSIPLEMELQIVVRHLMWMLGTKFGSSARTTSSLNHWGISLVLSQKHLLEIFVLIYRFVLDLFIMMTHNVNAFSYAVHCLWLACLRNCLLYSCLFRILGLEFIFQLVGSSIVKDGLAHFKFDIFFLMVTPLLNLAY